MGVVGQIKGCRGLGGLGAQGKDSKYGKHKSQSTQHKEMHRGTLICALCFVLCALSIRGAALRPTPRWGPLALSGPSSWYSGSALLRSGTTAVSGQSGRMLGEHPPTLVGGLGVRWLRGVVTWACLRVIRKPSSSTYYPSCLVFCYRGWGSDGVEAWGKRRMGRCCACRVGAIAPRRVARSSGPIGAFSLGRVPSTPHFSRL